MAPVRSRLMARSPGKPGTCAVGALFDDVVNVLLDIDGVGESAIGRPA